jgi:AAHS family benzoate transporter-like MFS transporter
MLRAGFNAKGSLSFLLVLNGGSLYYSVPGRFRGCRPAGPEAGGRRVVPDRGGGDGAARAERPLGVLLIIVAIAGLGTSGTRR